MAFVPYKGAAPAIADVLGNHIQVNASAKSVLLPLIKDGKLRGSRCRVPSAAGAARRADAARERQIYGPPNSRFGFGALRHLGGTLL